jgi:methionyl-tRNA formyltransferase
MHGIGLKTIGGAHPQRTIIGSLGRDQSRGSPNRRAQSERRDRRIGKAMSGLKITILVDNPDSWIVPYVEILIGRLERMGQTAHLVNRCQDIVAGDIAFFLGCDRIVPTEALNLNDHNIVVHESALPQGRGWSPLTWQILEGKNSIPITLFEAEEELDSGMIYLQDQIQLEGHELIDEIRALQAEKTIELCLRFVDAYPDLSGSEQKGQSSYYSRRTHADSEVNVDRTIEQLFDQFRVADNEKYPVFFCHRGFRYVLRIEKTGPAAEKEAGSFAESSF